VLSKGDMIEITYNSMTFEFLIMEITPEGPGISVIDTDLEVRTACPWVPGDGLSVAPVELISISALSPGRLCHTKRIR
jgi:ubiquitin fusion degradation protein 1